MDKAGADVWVLTEIGHQRRKRMLGRAVCSAPPPSSRRLSCWVAVTGPGAEPVGPPLLYERLAAAARVVISGQPVIVYGSVLPWRTAERDLGPDVVRPDEHYREVFDRLVAQQAADVCALQREFPGELVVWAGDFNQELTRPFSSGSKAGRDRLRDALDSLGMQAWNEQAAHALDGCKTIDLICGPSTVPPNSVERFHPTVGPRPLSDHAGYVVELDFPQA